MTFMPKCRAMGRDLEAGPRRCARCCTGIPCSESDSLLDLEHCSGRMEIVSEYTHNIISGDVKNMK